VSGYLLDSNHAGVLVTITHPLRQRVTACMAAGAVFYLIVPVITETVFGFRMLPCARQNAQEWDSLRPALALIDMDEDDALNAASLQVRLRRQGRQLSTVDALIATMALRYDLVLLTTDQDFDPVPSLSAENWMSR